MLLLLSLFTYEKIYTSNAPISKIHYLPFPGFHLPCSLHYLGATKTKQLIISNNAENLKK